MGIKQIHTGIEKEMYFEQGIWYIYMNKKNFSIKTSEKLTI